MDRATLAGIVGGGGFAAAMQEGKIPIEGEVMAMRQLLGTMDSFNPMFNILEP
jgi:alkyl sulfatase BDS1-like metallo-beta-lactamase superfamily hydrolase